MDIWSSRGALLGLGACLFTLGAAGCSQQRPTAAPIQFERHVLDTAFRSEGVTVVDVDGDGDRDVLVGDVAYLAPEWTPRTLISRPSLDPATQYSDAFAVFSHDFNHDTRPDLLVVGFPLAGAVWREQPAQDAPWVEHSVTQPAGTESPLFVKPAGYSEPVLVFARGSELVALEVRSDGSVTTTLAQAPVPIPGHGLGFGDINGDGAPDFLTTVGVFLFSSGVYRFVPADLGPDCAQMHVLDVDEDGRPDVVTSSAHAKGVFWHRQEEPGEDQLHFTRFTVDESFSQSHALEVADITGDGRPELITGKRRWAHGTQGDVEPDAPAVLYAFEFRKTRTGEVEWIRHEIDKEQDSGVGTQFEVTDVDGDGLMDIVTANKEGVFFFRQQGSAGAGSSEMGSTSTSETSSTFERT